MTEWFLYLPQSRTGLDDLVSRTQLAEQAGFDGIAFLDHLDTPMAPAEPIWEAMTVATWAAARTERLKIGHVVLCDAFRHPAVLAKQATTLAEASGGRFELGLGSGSMPDELAKYDISTAGPRERVAALGDTLAALRGRAAGVFVAELTRGIGTSGVRAGLIKVAGGFHGLDAHARWTLSAAAEAHHATGAPIAVHLKLGTGALDVLESLCGAWGVPPHRVLLGHLNRSPDAVVHRQAAGSGCWLAFDGPSRAHHATDWRMPEAVRELAEAGFGDRLPLGGDTTTAAARSVDGGPGMPYLLRRVAPRLALAVGEELVRRILTENPARAFAVEWR